MTEQDEKPQAVLTGLMPNRQRVLVTVWQDGTGEIALKNADSSTFEPPVALAKVEVE